MEVERKATAQELMISLGSDIDSWDTERDLRLKVTATKSTCTDFELSGISVRFTVFSFVFD